MTVIAGLEYSGGVLLACDSYVGDDSWKDRVASPKWRWIDAGQTTLLADAGSVWFGQIIDAGLRLPRRRRDEDDTKYIHRAVAAPLRELVKTADITLTGDDDTALCFLVATAGRLYTIVSDFGVVRSGYGYSAIGCASSYALGYLAGSDGEDPRRRLEKALRASMRHAAEVVEPFYFQDVKK